MATFTGTSANETITPELVSGTVTRVPPGSLPSAAADTVFGNGGDDQVDGGLGNDTLYGGEGNDQIAGGQSYEGDPGGNDLIDGGRGNDYLLGEGGNDTIYGGDGNDRIYGDVTDQFGYADWLYGGAGDDDIWGLGGDVIYGGEGNDTIGDSYWFYFPIGGNTLYGGGGNDTLRMSEVGSSSGRGGPGDDSYVIWSAGDAVFEANDEGTDTVVVWGSGFVPYDPDTGQWGTGSYTLPSNVENLNLENARKQVGDGDQLGDALRFDGTGNGLNNVITGNAATNLLLGLGGNDTLKGLAGNDTLWGGEGNDTLDGGTGADKMGGGTGTGNDTFYVDNAGDQVVEYTNQGTDKVFSSISHTLAANVENLALTGSALNGTGNTLANVITGNGAANTLSGLAGADTLAGGANADVLIGGFGWDRFDFNFVSDSTATARDAIRAGGGAPAFEGAGVAWGDVIDLSGIDANAVMPGNQAFVFGGTGVGHLSLVNSGTTTLVNGNIDNDTAFEFVLAIEDGGVLASAYKAGDFIL